MAAYDFQNELAPVVQAAKSPVHVFVTSYEDVAVQTPAVVIAIVAPSAERKVLFGKSLLSVAFHETGIAASG